MFLITTRQDVNNKDVVIGFEFVDLFWSIAAPYKQKRRRKVRDGGGF
jgi:hypothetical protein